MTSFQMPISDKDRKTGRGIYKVQKMIVQAIMDAKKETGLTQQALAKKLGVNRSVINRRVTGQANLTLLSLAELAWALDRELMVDFARPESNLERSAHPAEKSRHIWVMESGSETPVGATNFDHWFSLIRDHDLSGGFATTAQNDNGWHQNGDDSQSEAA